GRPCPSGLSARLYFLAEHAPDPGPSGPTGHSSRTSALGRQSLWASQGITQRQSRGSLGLEDLSLHTRRPQDHKSSEQQRHSSRSGFAKSQRVEEYCQTNHWSAVPGRCSLRASFSKCSVSATHRETGPHNEKADRNDGQLK